MIKKEFCWKNKSNKTATVDLFKMIKHLIRVENQNNSLKIKLI